MASKIVLFNYVNYLYGNSEFKSALKDMEECLTKIDDSLKVISSSSVWNGNAKNNFDDYSKSFSKNLDTFSKHKVEISEGLYKIYKNFQKNEDNIDLK